MTLIADSCDGPVSVRGSIKWSLYANTWKWKTRDSKKKRIICCGERDHLSTKMWRSGCEQLREGETPMNFICGPFSKRRHCWGTNALMHSLEYESKHKGFINYPDIHIKLAATKRTWFLLLFSSHSPSHPSFQPINHLSTHVNPRLY